MATAGVKKIGNIDILFHDQGRSADGHPMYPGFQPGTLVFGKNSVLKPGALPLPCDIVKDQDVAVKLRDGTTIYVDVLRPKNAKFKLPTIISWGPFGKNQGFNRNMFNKKAWRSGVPQHTVSSLENFEALDPAYWCNHGYAMVHPDIRGAWKSEGDSYIDSDQEGRDGYDLVEWIAEQEWSNQSWLSQCQWFVGAEKPPHLTCLCPYEGWNDMYNDTTNRGGIPDPGFQQGLLTNSYPGLGKTEDVKAMTAAHPMWNEYYESRRAKIENIDVPMYIVASWTNFLHTRGTFRGYMESYGCDKNKKWLRVHNSHEWPDLYYPQNTEDCRKFLDHYMKDISNGWEYTPPVRLSILNPGHDDVINRPETAFPIPRQQSVKMHLNPESSTLTWNEPVKTSGFAEFPGTGKLEVHPTDGLTSVENIAVFNYTFTEKTELTGFFSVHLFVSSPTEAEDIDIFANISKHAATGEKLDTNCVDVGWGMDDPEAEREKARILHSKGDTSVEVYYAEGPHGRLRVSHRELDAETSTPHWPRYTHKNYQPLKPGEIAEILVELWPCGMIWEAGETLRLKLGGYHLIPEHMHQLPPCPTLNKEDSKIRVHAGGEHDSYLLVPFIPKETT